MFEKFTENAIKIIMHSREEARRLEFSSVQTEHLFLGVLHDRVGICSLVLSKLGVELRKVRRVVERLIGRGYSTTPLNQVSFDINVMEIISNSVSLASGLGKETVLAEHILLALLRSNDSGILKVLSELNLDPDDIETEVKLFWQQDEFNEAGSTSLNLPEHYSPKFLNKTARAILEDARDETIRQGHIYIGTEQILLSLTKEKFNCLSQRFMKKFALDENTVRVEIHRIIGTGSGSDKDILTNTQVVEKALEYAWIEAKRFNYARIGSGHLLAGITTTDSCTSSHILKHLNIDPEQVRWEILYLLRKYSDSSEPEISSDDIENTLKSSTLNELSEDEEEEFIDPDYSESAYLSTDSE